MKKFWNNDKHTFQLLPEKGKFGFGHFLVALVFTSITFVIIGQLPLTSLILSEGINFDQNEKGMLQELAALFGTNKLLVLLLIPSILSLVALIFSIKYIHQSEVLLFFTARKKIDWSRVVTSFALWFGISLVMLGLSFSQHPFLKWNFNPSTFYLLFFISIILLPLQVTFEELFFRSYLFKGTSFLKRPILQVLIGGVLFGLMHIGNPEIAQLGNLALIFYIWTGIFLGLIAHFDNGLELAIGYHAANNIFASIIITSTWQVFQTDALWLDTSVPILSWDLAITLFLLQPFLLIFFNWKYKWGISFRKKNKL